MITKKDIEVFLHVYARLSTFEKSHRARAGWGEFNEDTDALPVPETVRVQKWLEELPEDLKCSCCGFDLAETVNDQP